MRYAPIFLLLMAACGAPGGSFTEAEGGHDVLDTALSGPVGYYSDTLPCADCAGMLVDLWVRSDSTFILQQHFIGRDTFASGMVGNWTVADGHLLLHYPMRVVRRLLPTPKGLQGLEQGALPIPEGQGGHTLPRLGDELAHGMAPMRLAGSFTYFADAMSFRPCGSERNWPSAGGREWTDEGQALGSMGTAELQERYLNAVGKGGDPWAIEVECSLAMGPAMEGDGADEYIFIHRVLRTLEPGQCP